MPQYERVLGGLVDEGEKAANRVQASRDVYEALSRKFKQSLEMLSEAKEKLQRAREESQVAELAVN